MLKKLLKGIDSIREYAMLIHTYIHTYIQGSRQKTREEVVYRLSNFSLLLSLKKEVNI